MEFSFDSLERRYQSLLSKEQKSNQHRQIAGIILMVMLGLLFGSVGISDLLSIDIGFEIIIGVIFGLIGIMIWIMNRSNRFIMKNDEIRFYRFYDAYLKLLTYHDTRSDEDQEKAVRSVTLLSNHISNWTVKSAPLEISALPNSVSNNLKNILIPALNQKLWEVISSFTNRLFNILIGISENDLTLVQIEQMDKDLKSYKIEKVVVEKKITESFTNKVWRFKHALIISGSIPVFITSQLLQEIQIGQIIERGLFFGLALIGVLFTIYAVEKRTGQQSIKKEKS